MGEKGEKARKQETKESKKARKQESKKGKEVNTYTVHRTAKIKVRTAAARLALPPSASTMPSPPSTRLVNKVLVQGQQ